MGYGLAETRHVQGRSLGWTWHSLTLNAKETSCYVDMAGRLWKCSREQIRPATEDEELSAELASVLSQELLEELRSGRAPRCLDVSGEAPTNDDDLVTGLDPDAPMPGEEPAARTRAGSPLGTPGAPEEPPARRPRRNSTSTVHEPESERAQSSVPTGTATPDTSAGSGGGRGALRNVPGDLPIAPQPHLATHQHDAVAETARRHWPRSEYSHAPYPTTQETPVMPWPAPPNPRTNFAAEIQSQPAVLTTANDAEDKLTKDRKYLHCLLVGSSSFNQGHCCHITRTLFHRSSR